METIGDCYVAVTGLPNPTKRHAVIMARFARDCLESMAKLTQQLESVLGPDTGKPKEGCSFPCCFQNVSLILELIHAADLKLRIGLHSGPVTAGVLRGDKGRFQL